MGSGSSPGDGGADSGSGKGFKGDPTDITNGNMYLSETDYVGAGSNPLRFERSYNSLRALNLSTGYYYYGLQTLGPEWTGTYFQSLYISSVTDSTTTYTTIYANRPDGRLLRFVLYNGAYVPDADVADVLTATSSGGYQYQTAHDTIETYNAAGQLQSIAPRGRAPVTLTYDSTGTVPSSVSDAFGHTLQFAYTDASSNYPTLQSITDPAGKTITYAYDSSSRLTSVTYPDGSSRSYIYNGTGRDVVGALTQLTDEAGTAYVSWSYGAAGTYVQSSSSAGGVNAYSFSYTGSSTTVTDPLGAARTYGLQQIHNVYRVSSSNTVCPGCGEDKARSFDANGNITLRTDFDNNQTSYSYDQDRNLETSRTEAYGTSLARTITTQWNSTWRQPALITEPNRTTAFTYDSMGNTLTKTITDTTVTPNVSRTWTYSYDSYGRVLAAKGPRTDVNSTTTYTYYTCTTGSQCGQVQTLTDAAGNVTTYNTYNAHGQALVITDPNGVVTTLTYATR